jgi:molybdenum cofactor guanylyltransferase
MLAGIFVGGLSRRMQGRPKGLLPSPDPGQSVIERLIGVVHELGAVDVVLVGDATPYATLGLPSVGDDPPGLGPIGGLIGLLECARLGPQRGVLALACDLPYVTAALLERLLLSDPHAAAVVPRADGVLQPLCARYVADECLPVARAAVVAGERALFRVVERLGARAVVLELSGVEANWLRDWDTPEDVRRGQT